MADNIEITEGSGTVMATDDAAGVHYSKAKLIDGTADSTTPIVVDIGAKANALRVVPANDITDATYIGDIKFGESLPAGTNEIGKLAAGTAAIGKLAANSGVDIGDVTLTAGTAAFGKLAANTGVDIGDVDVTSIVPGVAATNLGKAEDAAHSSGDVGVATMTVRQDTAAALSGTDADYQPLITDANGRLHVIDVSTTAIKTAVELVDNAVYVDDADWTDNTSSHLLVGGIYQSAPHTVTDGDVSPFQLDVNGKIIESNSAAIETAVEIIDDWDAVHDSAASSDGPQIMAAYDSTKPTAVGDADAVRVLADAYGRLLPGLEPEWFNAVYDSADATAEGKTVKAATAGKKIYILTCILSSDVEGWMKLQDEDSNALTGKMWFKAGGGIMATWPPQAPLVLNVANKALEVIVEAAGDISVTITGYLAP